MLKRRRSDSEVLILLVGALRLDTGRRLYFHYQHATATKKKKTSEGMTFMDSGQSSRRDNFKFNKPHIFRLIRRD